jgi:EmrB/QacA subfamily drug resistance transporter
VSTQAPAPRGLRATAGLVVACASQFLIGVDGLAVAIALPTLRDDLGIAPIEGQWVLTAYALCFGGGLLLGGRLGDLYGRRRVLSCGLALFAAGSLLAAVSPGLGVLIAGRAAQGAGSAAAIPATLALIGSLYPAGPERTSALALLAGMATLGVLSGMLFGGLVTSELGWRWVFGLAAPVALATALAAPRALPEIAADGVSRQLDVAGAVLVTAASLAFLFGITRVEGHGIVSAVVLVPVAGSLLLFGAFVRWERRTRVPLVRLDILRVRALRAATAAIGINAVAFTAVVYVGTLYLQDGLGYSPSRAGLALLPIDVMGLAVSLLAGRILAGRSPRRVLLASFVADVIALLWLARTPEPAHYVVDVMLPLAVLGVSLCLTFIIATQQAVADVSADEKGLASGIFESANHLFGGAVGVALYATLVAASGYAAAFLAAAVLAGLAAVGALRTG